QMLWPAKPCAVSQLAPTGTCALWLKGRLTPPTGGSLWIRPCARAVERFGSPTRRRNDEQVPAENAVRNHGHEHREPGMGGAAVRQDRGVVRCADRPLVVAA